MWILSGSFSHFSFNLLKNSGCSICKFPFSSTIGTPLNSSTGVKLNSKTSASGSISNTLCDFPTPGFPWRNTGLSAIIQDLIFFMTDGSLNSSNPLSSNIFNASIVISSLLSLFKV